MAYSPNNKFLCVGNHSQNIYIFSVAHKYKPCKAIYKNKLAMSSAINGIDWSIESDALRTSSQAGEVLVWSINEKGGRDFDTHGEQTIAKKHWVTHTIKRGWCTEDIYPSGEDGSHINDVNWCASKEYIFTGDDWGQLNVYRNPVRLNSKAGRKKKRGGDAPGKFYRAHSEHVMRIAIDGDSADRLFTVGGQDQCLI